MRPVLIALAATTLLASGASAQQPVELMVVKRDTVPALASANRNVTLADVIKRKSGEGLVLHLDCPTPYDCRGATALLMVDPNVPISVAPKPGATDRAATFSIAATQLRETGELPIRIKLGDRVLEPELRTDVGETVSSDMPLVGSYEFACDQGFDANTVVRGRKDLKAFVTNSIGNVVLRPTRPVDTDDRVAVITLGSSQDAGRIRIRRISEFGLPGQIDILGAGASTDIIRQSGGMCSANYAILADFAAGKGEVEIARIEEDGSTKVLSTFDFGVDHLYTGAFGFGPVITGLKDRDYTLLGDTTIFESRNYRNGGRYVLSYTHFVHGRRNLDSSPLDQATQINPFIAIGTKDVFDNVMGGASIDLFGGTVFLLVGGHGGRVNKLITTDSVGVGKKWRYGAANLPIRKEWDWAPFGGITVDLRAAVQLFTKILGARTTA